MRSCVWNNIAPRVNHYWAASVLSMYPNQTKTGPDLLHEERFVEVPVDTENYYINVMLLKKHTFTNRMAFEVCKSVIYKGINSNNGICILSDICKKPGQTVHDIGGSPAGTPAIR